MGATADRLRPIFEDLCDDQDRPAVPLRGRPLSEQFHATAEEIARLPSLLEDGKNTSKPMTLNYRVIFGWDG